MSAQAYSISSPTGHTVDWGLCDYETALEKQLQRVQEVHDGVAPDSLIFVEHPPVYTLGRRIGAEKHILWNDQQRQQRGIALYEATRGGDVTYHAPGQLVGYPIVNLNHHRDLHAWLRLLEECLIRTVGCFGLAASRRKGKTGIWLADRKVAAIGVAVKQWVTYHGFALNVNIDLDGFQGIVPCGITDGSVTSMQQELGVEIPLSEVKSVFAVEFWKLFTDIRST